MALRPFTLDDIETVNALHRSVWFPVRSPAAWRWLADNPARIEAGAPIGWVMEDRDGRIAAFIGNFIQRFWRGDEGTFGATGFSTIVTPDARGASRSLFRAVIEQPGLFSAYTFNANVVSAPLYARQGAHPWPPGTHDLKLSWVIDPVVLFRSRLLRWATKRAAWATDPYRERYVGRRVDRPEPADLPPGVERLDDLGDGSDYADFWTRLRSQRRLVADRSPATLRWRLGDPDQTRPPLLIAVRRGARITGYAMGVLTKLTEIEPVVLEVIDLIALDGEDAALRDLMQGMLALGRAHGAAKVRMSVVGQGLLDRLGPLAKSARHEGGHSHCHVRFLDGEATDWSPTPFDGDHGICQRPVPRSKR